MIGLPLAFAAPAALLVLFAVPALIWLLRHTPPRPTVVDFPPTALMRDLVPPEETPARTPWWLVALRIAVVALLAIALGHPVWAPSDDDDGRSGPLWLLVDDGWPAAADWPVLRAAAERRIDAAGARGRPVLLLGTAGGGGDRGAVPLAADEARRRLAVWTPNPWAENRPAALATLGRAAAAAPPGSVVWLGHGVDLADGDTTGRFAEDLARLAASATPPAPVLVSLPARAEAVALDRLDNGADATTARVIALPDDAGLDGRLVALDAKGRRLAEVPWRIAPGERAADVRVDLPLDLRNDVARVEILGRRNAGAVRLADDRWRRRAVAILSGTAADRDQPLLGPTRYLESALAPVADLRRPRERETDAALREAIAGGVSMLVLADVGTLSREAGDALLAWVRRGGLLLRFAGPRLAAAARPDDPLLPVPLRRGERALGGALSWASPRGLGPFADDGPFAGMAVPADVKIARQLLAEPSAGLADRVWASLDDGTPLVTARSEGRGRVVLVHVGADTAWSDLPLSGAFVEMMRRVVALAGPAAEAGSGRASATAGGLLPPWRLLDGFGLLAPPPPDAKPVAAADVAGLAPSRDHPPGLWGRDGAVVALQTVPTGTELRPLAPHLAGRGVTVERRGGDAAIVLAPSLLVAALLLALLDGVVMLRPLFEARQSRRRSRRMGAAAVLVLAAALAVVLAAPPAGAAEPASAAGPQPGTAAAADAAITAATRDAALAPRLAHVVTGDAAVDDVAHRGLAGLSRGLADRTAFEPAEPAAVDPAVDDLSVYALLYWPVVADAPPPSPRAIARLDAFMKSGGTVLFDTRDADDAALLAGTGRTTPAGTALRRLLSGLDLPTLEPVPPDHVLGRTFYLLPAFPGRFDGPLWVEATPEAGPDEADRPARPGDGVSPIIVTGNDLAGAWARDDGDDDLLPMATADPRGRETALRVGINVVMYVLTGNYKADQVHVPALLERLGR